MDGSCGTNFEKMTKGYFLDDIGTGVMVLLKYRDACFFLKNCSSPAALVPSQIDTGGLQES